MLVHVLDDLLTLVESGKKNPSNIHRMIDNNILANKTSQFGKQTK